MIACYPVQSRAKSHRDEINLINKLINKLIKIFLYSGSLDILCCIKRIKAHVQSNMPHAVTSIQQSPVLKGHIFLVLSIKISHQLNLF